jgi:ribosomal-protein-alanine N-acetyltransferase
VRYTLGEEVRVIIRRFTAADAEAVLAIERANQPTPWTLGRFEGFSTLVAEVDGRVVGVACHSVNHWPGRDETLTLANLSVDAAFRRRGIGRALLEARLRLGAAAGVLSAFTVTRYTNEPLKALYRQYGFRERTRLPGYYDDRGEDGLLLERALDPEADPPWRDAPPSTETATAVERLREAGAALEKGEYDRALALADEVAVDPEATAAARWLRISALDGQGRHVEATLETQRLAAETGAPWAVQMLGERYAGAGLPDAALGYLLAAVPITPGIEPNSRLWSSLGLTWERLGRYVEAAWAYERLVREDPQSGWGRGRGAYALLHLDRPLRALELCEEAIALQDGIAELHKTRGLALWKLGQREAARQALCRALELDPEHQDAVVHLAALEAEAEAPRL